MQLRKNYLILFLLFFFLSCKKENKDLDPQPQYSPTLHNYSFQTTHPDNVSIEKALMIAEKFALQKEFLIHQNTLSPLINKEDILVIPDRNNEPAMYVITFNSIGYVIVSATTRETPILGYANHSGFDIENISLGMANWFYGRMNKIEHLRNDPNYEKDAMVDADWDNILKDSNLKSGGTVVSQYGPLLTSLWRQGVPYNNLVPHTGCTSYSNGRAPVGCVATAIGQVLRYHAYPSYKYNWSVMPNKLYSSSSSSAKTEVAKLMRDVGSYVGMDYGCSGSGANTGDAVNVFRNNYYYSSGGIYANRSDSDAEPLVKADIIASRPVIMAGNGSYTKRTIGWWKFKKTFTTYHEGHAWVCDGYQRVRKEIKIFGTRIPYHKNYYHMNWGWGGIGQRSYDNNGWFVFGDISMKDPSAQNVKGKSYNFQYNRRYITDIRP